MSCNGPFKNCSNKLAANSGVPVGALAITVDVPLTEKLATWNTDEIMDAMLVTTGDNAMNASRADVDNMLHWFGNPEFPENSRILAAPYHRASITQLQAAAMRMRKVVEANPDFDHARLRPLAPNDIEAMSLKGNRDQTVAGIMAKVGEFDNATLSEEAMGIKVNRNGRSLAHIMATRNYPFTRLDPYEYDRVIRLQSQDSRSVAHAIVSQGEPLMVSDSDTIWTCAQRHNWVSVAHKAAENNVSFPSAYIGNEDREGNTVAHYAAIHGLDKIPTNLIFKANLDGITPAHIAAENGHFVTVDSLYGLETNDGVTVADVIRGTCLNSANALAANSLPPEGNRLREFDDSPMDENIAMYAAKSGRMRWQDMDKEQIRLAYSRAVHDGFYEGFDAWMEKCDKGKPLFDETGMDVSNSLAAFS